LCNWRNKCCRSKSQTRRALLIVLTCDWSCSRFAHKIQVRKLTALVHPTKAFPFNNFTRHNRTATSLPCLCNDKPFALCKHAVPFQIPVSSWGMEWNRMQNECNARRTKPIVIVITQLLIRHFPHFCCWCFHIFICCCCVRVDRRHKTRDQTRHQARRNATQRET
jgi:hypothetical protein